MDKCPDPYRVALMLLKVGKVAPNAIEFGGWRLSRPNAKWLWLYQRPTQTRRTCVFFTISNDSQLGRAVRAAWK